MSSRSGVATLRTAIHLLLTRTVHVRTFHEGGVEDVLELVGVNLEIGAGDLLEHVAHVSLRLRVCGRRRRRRWRLRRIEQPVSRGGRNKY